jgi:hypothetical protein
LSIGGAPWAAHGKQSFAAPILLGGQQDQDPGLQPRPAAVGGSGILGSLVADLRGRGVEPAVVGRVLAGPAGRIGVRRLLPPR